MVDELREHQVELNIFHFATGGQDDFESLKEMVAMGVKPDRTVLVLKEGLAGASQSVKDPFERLLSGRTVTTYLEQGAVNLKMPTVLLATMVAADALFIGLHQAANGEISKNESGAPHKNAVPLPYFRRLELRCWLKLMTDRLNQLNASEWLS